MRREDFLPTTAADCARRGWDAPDFVYVCGDAYVDHPSFGHAIISRVLESAGYRVAMLCQPDWRSAADFQRFGKPKLGFLCTAGAMDSMVNHYTAAKKRRGEDAYSPGGRTGLRPDRALTVYGNRIHEAYADVPLLIGGIEASLRRFSHYDYWEDKVRHSVLVDSCATVLMYGMGEETVLALARWLREGANPERLQAIRGICYMRKTPPEGVELLPGHSAVCADRRAYARAFLREYEEQDPVRGKPLCQQQDTARYLVQTPPAMPLARAALDRVYALPYQRAWHPDYDALGGVPALREVLFSISATRGCFGACNFCALTFHQGRIVTSRSPESIVAEARLLTRHKDFKGYIHDIGGPTANFRRPACEAQLRRGACRDRQCLFPTPCKHLTADHRELVDILRRVRALPGVKKVFIRSGIRYDYVMADRDATFLKELCRHHVSGQLKVAPEHVAPRALEAMGKPDFSVYQAFETRYRAVNAAQGQKQYLVPYLMSSHPGCDLHAAIALAQYLKASGHNVEQVQDFYPTPGTLSTCMFYTGLDPRTMQSVYVPRSPGEKAMQRALLQPRSPQNRALVQKALRVAGREDLIGERPECLASAGPPAKRGAAAPAGKRPAQKKKTPGKAGAKKRKG